MNVFRLVLCLTGLVVYLIAKQFVSPTAVPPSAPAASKTPEASQPSGISSLREVPGAVTYSKPIADVPTANSSPSDISKSVPN